MNEFFGEIITKSKCRVDVTNTKECRQLNYGIMESVDFWRIQVYGLARR